MSQGVQVNARPRHADGSITVRKVQLNESNLRPLFDIRQEDAAQLLGVSLSSLKSACRRLGINRWPYTRNPSPREERDMFDFHQLPSNREDQHGAFTHNHVLHLNEETAVNCDSEETSRDNHFDDSEDLFQQILDLPHGEPNKERPPEAEEDLDSFFFHPIPEMNGSWIEHFHPNQA
ncbi:hypothetical protein GUITHDRAFT_111464 [Guillardia theta CCMP2712]|uniref:RWP-RK domain-containing protein n=1 Tax=Guillardia theta (strain CCMP2712) TaxID=905079 RepID=L1J2F2_GUITC|nr:hypothetical protein GUITHDRAFT_111464 [Guillardia theta CCMP2712]EKX42492.1 hypothetical protein GUITHDRAFT_111464 [Guillardia theta CCMP2712]|eukprot:XP_005829472.1 hypothetical protein GUITHDRAFT_111464 [Guillardia theta CCMP2712]